MDSFNEAFELGDWQVDVGGNRLLRGSEVRPLRHKAMALLVLLARHAGQTVPRETLVREVWDGNPYVADKAINTAVWTIRQALGDDPESPRYVQTVAKKGYRLVAAVHWRPTVPAVQAPAAQPSPAKDTKSAPAAHNAPAWLGVALLLLLVATAAMAIWRQARAPAPAAAAFGSPTPLTQLPGLEYVGRLSPDGRWLAFGWWKGSGNGRLYLRRADAPDEPPREISGEWGDVEGLSWAPDSQALAFTATDAQGRCTLWRVALAGEPRQALARCASLFTPSVDWSPDGRRIAFSGEASGAAGLFSIAPDGSDLRRMTTAAPRAMADHQPAWSPDGRRLAFVRQDPADGTRDLFELEPGGAERRITTLRQYRWHGLTWADNGRDLIYATTQQDRRVLMRWDRAAGVAVPLGLEGSAPARPAQGGLVFALLRSHVSIARWSAGATSLERVITSVGSDREPHEVSAAPGTVFVSRRVNAPELWLAPRDGQPPRALTRLAGVVSAPAWAPTGDRVAFLGSCGPAGRYGLCRLDLGTGDIRALATDAAAYGRPAWHPDGRSVWVSSERGGRWQVWRLDATSGQAQAVATALEPGRVLEWAPDGRHFVTESQDRQTLHWHRPDGHTERSLAVAPGMDLVDWRLGPAGLVLLTRGQRERLERLDPASGRRTTLADLPLGTFPERARLSLGAQGALLVEVADTATADLMQVR